MKAYWDYTEKERSMMTEKDVSALLNLELMTHGVAKVVPPLLRDIEPIELETITYYEVHGIYFETAEQADAFLKLMPMRSEYDYYGAGYNYQYAKLIDDGIVPKKLYRHADIISSKNVLTKNKEAREFNEKAEKEYEKASKEMDKVLNGVWEDWYRCQELAAKHKKLMETKKEYLAITSDDESLAMVFLKKLFSDEDIQKAIEWFN